MLIKLIIKAFLAGVSFEGGDVEKAAEQYALKVIQTN